MTHDATIIIRDGFEWIAWHIDRTPSGCWEWMGHRNPEGYGHCTFEGKPWSAHRLVFSLSMGAIPEGKLICHRCDNPPCVNPGHLYAGTHEQNRLDRLVRGDTFRPWNLPWNKRTLRPYRSDIPCH